MFQTLMAIRTATLAARTRTGDDSIGTRVDAGRVQLVRVTYPHGKRKAANEQPLSDWLTADGAIAALNAL